ncbi:MAG TPA: adenylate/guanylate cyclase domain-containing protein [Stenomitos sp.]
MTVVLETIASYVPRLTSRRYLSNPSPLTAPEQERLSAAVLFADISGFTALTERLAQQGRGGAEELSRILNGYFGALIDTVEGHGGDIVKFAGDALLVVWPDDGVGLEQTTLRAAKCALAMQGVMHEHRLSEGGEKLRLRVGLGSGELSLTYVGGLRHRWEVLLTGEPIARVGRACQQASPGEVVLTPTAWEWVRPQGTGEPLVTGGVRLDGLLADVPLDYPQAILLPSEAEATLREYLPGAVLSRLAAGQVGWLAELRQITVLFVHLVDLDRASVEQTQAVVQALQGVLYRFEGSFNKLNVDEKGVALVAAFGLPPISHEDDAARGVQAALAMQEALRSLGVRASIGVATGRAFCGEIGNERRREYTMIGDTVNLAARLMTAADGDLLCDFATYEAASHVVAFDALPPVALKGKTGPIGLFRPVGRTARAKLPPSTMVGRTAERERLLEYLDRMNAGEHHVVVVEAEAGLGKSRLMADLCQQAEAMGVAAWTGAADAIEKSTPYLAWRGIFGQLLGLEELPEDPEVRREHVTVTLGADPETARLLPLLEAVLPLGLPDNDFTVQLSGPMRADNTITLLLRLLEKASEKQGALLVLDDAQWMDSASWALALQVREQVKSLMLVLAMRPMSEPLPPVVLHFLQDPALRRMTLKGMPAEDIEALICQRLGMTSLPESVATFIQERAEGHPFFSEELALAMRDAGLLQVRDGVCVEAPGASDLRELDLPNTVEGVITSRIDRLPVPQQFALKVASVIGRLFAFRTLRDVYPIDTDKPQLADILEALEKLDLTHVDPEEPDLSYSFRHIVTHEVVYNLMLYTQRQQLHRAVAEWFERNHAENLAPYYALLAHHWRQANAPDQALKYLDLAARQSLHSFANREAAKFLKDALDLDAQLGFKVGPLQRAYWECELGNAYYQLGEIADGQKFLFAGLKALGWPLARSQGGMVLGSLVQFWRQVAHRLFPGLLTKRHLDDSERYTVAARASRSLSYLAYFNNDIVLLLYSQLHSLNLAEQAKPSPEQALNYMACLNLYGALGMHWLAPVYKRYSLSVLEALQHPPTRAKALMLEGIYLVGNAACVAAIRNAEDAIAISDEFGDGRTREECLVVLSYAHYFIRELPQALSSYQELASNGRQRGDRQTIAWGMLGTARVHLAAGGTEQAQQVLAEAERYAEDSLSRSELHGMSALVHWRRGQEAQAHEQASIALRLMLGLPITSFSVLPGYACVAETMLGLLAASKPGSNEHRELRKEATKACRNLFRAAKVYRVGQPLAWRYWGVLKWIEGRQAQARSAWAKAIALSESHGLPYDGPRPETGLDLRTL